jgi:hypothetical protein
MNGQSYSPALYFAQRQGGAGQPIELTFSRNSLIKDIIVKRIDARLLAQYTKYDNYFAQSAARTRYW